MKIKIAFALIAVVLSAGFFAACPVEEAPIAVTITFDSDGAGDFPSVTLTSGETLGEKLPAPTKPGYDFLGWYDGVTKYTDDTPIGGENLNLVARWRLTTGASSFNVTFSAGTGGIPLTEIKSVEQGKSLGLNFPAAPRRKGYQFNGWQTTGGAAFTSATVVTSSITVTAVWAAKTSYTVTFAVGSGTSDVPDPITVYNGDFVDEWGFVFPDDPEPPPYDSLYAAYRFEYWIIDGTQNEVFTNIMPVTSDINVTATYRFGLKQTMKAELDLSQFYTGSWTAINRPGGGTGPGGGSQAFDPVTGLFTASFTGGNQGIAIRTPNGIIAPSQPNIRAGLEFADYVLYEIEGEADPDEERLFRIIIGRNDSSSNWDGVNATSQMLFSEFLTTDEDGKPIGITATTGARKDVEQCREWFMIQARENTHTAASPTNVTIRKITITIW